MSWIGTGVEVVQFLSALLYGGDEIGLLQDSQVLADRLPRALPH
jgi:hypothetical protein